MQTVVLAAGEGTRMRPLTARRPKPMLPVAGRPMLEHVLDAAIEGGASKLVIVVGYREDAVRGYFGDAYRDVPIEYARQTEQAGTADAVRAAKPHLAAEPFVVLAGDNLYGLTDLEPLYASTPAIGAYRVEDPRPYGVLELDGDRVTGVIEKPDDPPSKQINASAYAFEARALDWLDEVEESARGEYELTDVLARQIEAGPVSAIDVDRWLDVGRPWELLEANEWKLENLERNLAGEVHGDAEIVGNVLVQAGARVRRGVTIEGPALVRSGASVGPNAFVRGPTVLGPNATVGHAVEVKNSVLMENATAGHLTYIGDSVIGRDVNFGASTTVANLRHDREPIHLDVKGEQVSTGREKFGVVVGDGVKTGIDTSLNAGVKLSADERTGPGEVVRSDR